MTEKKFIQFNNLYITIKKIQNVKPQNVKCKNLLTKQLHLTKDHFDLVLVFFYLQEV
jgi:hypothetical protein